MKNKKCIYSDTCWHGEVCTAKCEDKKKPACHITSDFFKKKK